VTTSKPTTPPAPPISDADLAQRRDRYARHLPVYPLRTSRAPEALADRPEFVACAAERAAVLAIEQRMAHEHAELVARNEATAEAHRAAQRQAMLTGTPPPRPLQLEPWPYPAHTRETFSEFHAIIEATELGLLEEHSARWREELESAADLAREELAQARQLVAAAEAKAQPYLDALAAVAGYRDVDDRIVPPGRPEQLPRAEAEELERIRQTFGQPERRSVLHGRR
jgi:hypothetical protein